MAEYTNNNWGYCIRTYVPHYSIELALDHASKIWCMYPHRFGWNFQKTMRGGLDRDVYDLVYYVMMCKICFQDPISFPTILTLSTSSPRRMQQLHLYASVRILHPICDTAHFMNWVAWIRGRVRVAQFMK